MAKSESPATPTIDDAALVRHLTHEVETVKNALFKQMARLELILDALSNIAPPRDAGALNTMALGAGPVAHNLDIQQHPDGSAVFAIDSGKHFSLGPRLAEVFQFLASGDNDRSGKDALVGWRSRMEIIGFLEKHAGKRFRPTYINGMVYLLKEALRKAGYDPRLIQSHRQKGIRLAYKPGAPGPPHPWPDVHSSLL